MERDGGEEVAAHLKTSSTGAEDDVQLYTSLIKTAVKRFLPPRTATNDAAAAAWQPSRSASSRRSVRCEPARAASSCARAACSKYSKALSGSVDAWIDALNGWTGGLEVHVQRRLSGGVGRGASISPR